MTTLQKTIKYFAIAAAILLSVSILSIIASVAIGIFSGIGMFGNSISSKTNIGIKKGQKIEITEELMDFQESFSNIESIEVENSASEFYIKTGNEFRVEANNVSRNFSATVKSGTLTIEDDGWRIGWFGARSGNPFNSVITLYVPEDFVGDTVSITTGAGTIIVDQLTTESLNVNAGAGKIDFDNTNSKDTRIEGGVGSLSFTNANLGDLHLSCGVGKTYIEGIVYGDSKIECGVGNLEMKLTGSIDDYDLTADMGIGEIRINGTKYNNRNWRNSNAPNSLEIDGGIGSAYVDFN
ncbi:MAG: DUF4097 domain-containing protein [Clostridiales bacterium]|nr:DUF4097 domain-containing protein [Clostridiales bacterium]